MVTSAPWPGTHSLDYCHSIIRLEVGERVHQLCSFSHWLFCAPCISLWKRNHLSLSVKKPGGSLWGILWSPWVFFQFVDQNEPIYLDLCFSATKNLQFSMYSSYTSLVFNMYSKVFYFSRCYSSSVSFLDINCWHIEVQWSYIVCVLQRWWTHLLLAGVF